MTPERRTAGPEQADRPDTSHGTRKGCYDDRSGWPIDRLDAVLDRFVAAMPRLVAILDDVPAGVQRDRLRRALLELDERLTNRQP